MDPQLQLERLDLVLSIARREVAAAAYPFPMDTDEIESSAGAVYAMWARPGAPGERAGFVEYVQTPRGPSPLLLDVENAPDELRSTLRKVARAVVKPWKDQRSREGALTTEQQATIAAPEGADLEAAAAESEALQQIVDALNRMERGTVGQRTRATLVRLHLGESVFPGQPRRLMPTRRWNRKTRQWDIKKAPAYADYLNYHALGQERQAGQCPTCRTIAKFVQSPVLDAAAVSNVIDAFNLRLASRG